MINKPLNFRIHFKYLFVGTFNTLFFYLNSCIFMYLGLMPHSSQIVASLISLFSNFYSFKYILFQGQRQGSNIKYLLQQLINYLSSFLILCISLDYLSNNKYIATAITVLIVSIINYFLVFNWTFKK